MSSFLIAAWVVLPQESLVGSSTKDNFMSAALPKGGFFAISHRLQVKMVNVWGNEVDKGHCAC